MTDKTAIAALRDMLALALKGLTERLTDCNRLNYCWDELSAFEVFSSTVIDQLEAERQRADAARKYGSERDSENESLMLTVGRLRTELSALRGTQEPFRFAVVDDKGSVGYTETLEDAEFMSLRHGGSVIPLFTLPPKPVVVLPIGFKPCLDRTGAQSTSYKAIMSGKGDWLHKAMVMEKLDAAGIEWKDSE